MMIICDRCRQKDPKHTIKINNERKEKCEYFNVCSSCRNQIIESIERYDMSGVDKFLRMVDLK